MAYTIFFFICLALVVVPLLAFGVLLVVGRFSPRVKKKSFQQLRRPFAIRGGTKSEFALQKERHHLEDEVIRRFGPPGTKV
jgi:hypothetical protein